MHRSLLILLVITAVFTTAFGLKCYVCGGEDDTCSKENLEKDKDTKSVTCTTGLDKCMRVWSKKDDKESIANTCSNQAGCDAATKVCDELTDGECKAACCDADDCNAATSVSFSLFLMTVCSVVGLMFLK